MPPKKGKKTTKDKYVLIWWVIDGQKTITELSKISPTKRIKNETVKLKWEGTNGKKKFYFAKIIEFGETIEELDSIRLDNKGNVCDDSKKLYSETVLDQKKKMNVSKQLTTEFKKKNNNAIVQKIIEQKAIFSIDDQPLSKNSRNKISKFNKVNEITTLNTKEDVNSKPSEREFLNQQNTSGINDLEIHYAVDQQEATIDKSLDFLDDNINHPSYSNDFSNVKTHFEDGAISSESGLAAIWNSNYLNNWSNICNPTMIAPNFQLQVSNNADQVLPSTLLELGSMEKDTYNTPILKFPPCHTQKNLNINDKIFRPWGPSATTENTTAVSMISNTFACSRSTEEEIYLESTVGSAGIDISVDQINNLPDEDRTIDIGSLATYLKNEVGDIEINFLRMLEKSIRQAYDSYQRYDRHSSKIFDIPDFYMQPGEFMMEIASGSKIYFPINVKNQIEKVSEQEDGSYDWEVIIKLALKEVYGDNISNYSAKDWVKEKVGSNKIITSKQFNNVINKFSANKRGNENSQPDCPRYSEHPDSITEENLHFFQKVLKIAEEAYDIQQRELLPERQTHQLSNVYTKSAAINKKISPNYEIYLPRSTHLYIERKSEVSRGKYDWKILVKETLLEIYGDRLKEYSAKGVRGGSPGINVELYRALYDWASLLVNESVILDTDFADYINHLTANKKKRKNK